MNQKTLNIIFGLVIVILIGAGAYFVIGKKSEPANNQPIVADNANNTEPTNQVTPTPNPTAPLAQSQVYNNQYMRVTIPSGWSAKQATNNPTALNITKGNYILYIDSRTGQASGIQGGRFSEIAGGAPSADAVTTPGNGSCGTSNTTSITTNGTTAQRVDYYVGVNDKTESCNVPTNGQSVWYFSYITTGTNGYFNEYNIPNMPNVAWVVTMAYNSKNINSLPVKGSADLNQALTDMTNILKTLKINAPVAYVPAVSQTISAMSSTYWTAETSEGVNSPVESCTDTSSTNNISQSSVKASYHMEAGNSDRKTLFTSSDTQSRLATVEGILANNGWTKCNTINKQSPAGSSLQTTDAIDVYQNGKDFVDVDSNFAENPSIGIPLYNIWLTFFTLK
jgi:hypothetical protein